jgi:dynein heavy chain
VQVLSVIGQQIMTIQLALKGGVPRIDFEGSNIAVLPGFGVFITMNPGTVLHTQPQALLLNPTCPLTFPLLFRASAGYAGRSDLPDSLKALFRPVAMMVPDYALIGEIMFFAYGYLLEYE